MMEVEFVSEVLIAFSNGMQDKKKSIHTFYGEYDETFPLAKSTGEAISRSCR